MSAHVGARSYYFHHPFCLQIFSHGLAHYENWKGPEWGVHQPPCTVVLVLNFSILKNPQSQTDEKQNFANHFFSVFFKTFMKKNVHVFPCASKYFVSSSTIVFKFLKATSFPFSKTHNKRFYKKWIFSKLFWVQTTSYCGTVFGPPIQGPFHHDQNHQVLLILGS